MATTRPNKSPAQSSEEENGLKTGYLVAYNVLQMLGWAAILMAIAGSVYEHGNVIYVYRDVSRLLNIFQTLAVLEILHCACGLVRSGVVLTALQVFSRVFCTWGVAYSIKSVQLSSSVFMFMTAWAITEVIRYAFYFFNLVGNIPYVIKWCRYTFFIVLYPIGVAGELLSVINGLDEVKRTKMYSYPLPNALNMSFSFYYFLIFFMLSYIPVFPQLYMHMLAQRKKIIGGESGQRPKTD